MTLPASCISESCIKRKVNLNFYFHTFFMVPQNVLWHHSSSDIATGRVKHQIAENNSVESLLVFLFCFVFSLNSFHYVSKKSKQNFLLNYIIIYKNSFDETYLEMKVIGYVLLFLPGNFRKPRWAIDNIWLGSWRVENVWYMQGCSSRYYIVLIFKFEEVLHVNLVLLYLTLDK